MKSVTRIICGLAFASAAAAPSSAQSAQASHPAFDVVSVKPNKSDSPPYSNFPLNSGDFYTPNGGLFSATNWPLVTYIFFAYKLQGNQGQLLVSQLPGWVTTDRFDIQARTNGDPSVVNPSVVNPSVVNPSVVNPSVVNPSKDQMRLMMRSLLADRFKFATHNEMREVSVLAFVLAKPGNTGPQLRPHPADAPCQTNVEPPSAAAPIPNAIQQIVAGGLPALCNGILGMPPSVPGRSRLAGRNVTIGFMADMFSQRVNPGRPMIDATGLKGTFDFQIEFAPDPDEPTFEQALRDQLGLKMESRKSAMDIMVLDHIEHPSEN